MLECVLYRGVAILQGVKGQKYIRVYILFGQADHITRSVLQYKLRVSLRIQKIRPLF